MSESTDLAVVGGGVMGLFTAYHAARHGHRVVVLERGRVGDPNTASYGRTRSYRPDYLDPAYVRLAEEARRLWEAFEREEGARVLVHAGCLNIATRSITADLQNSYAELSHAVLARMGIAAEALDRAELERRYPYLDADLGRLAVDGGVVDLQAVRRALTQALAARGVEVREGVELTGVDRALRITTDRGELSPRALVVTAGHGTNEVLERIAGCRLRVPITRDRPSEAKYLTPETDVRDRFTAEHMPVIAYLDTGIYCHPIVPGLVDAVKIGYYNPPDMPRRATEIDSVSSFVERCLPGLRGAAMSDVDDYDGCDYDLVSDDEFVLGPIPGVPNAFVGVGWRGTGYKFAPWVGRTLTELAVQDGTVYDIARFSPARFEATA